LTNLSDCVEGIAVLKEKIYRAKAECGLNFVEIGEMLHIPSSTAKELYIKARALRTGGDYSWLEGLSNRAINQIKKTKYKDFNSLCYDVLHDVVDLQDYPWIGKKVAVEVKRWCKSRPNRIDAERRVCERRNE
jgi:hypothetical protein